MALMNALSQSPHRRAARACVSRAARQCNVLNLRDFHRRCVAGDFVTCTPSETARAFVGAERLRGISKSPAAHWRKWFCIRIFFCPFSLGSRRACDVFATRAAASLITLAFFRRGVTFPRLWWRADASSRALMHQPRKQKEKRRANRAAFSSGEKLSFDYEPSFATLCVRREIFRLAVFL